MPVEIHEAGKDFLWLHGHQPLYGPTHPIVQYSEAVMAHLYRRLPIILNITFNVARAWLLHRRQITLGVEYPVSRP